MGENDRVEVDGTNRLAGLARVGDDAIAARLRAEPRQRQTVLGLTTYVVPLPEARVRPFATQRTSPGLMTAPATALPCATVA